MPNKPAPLRIIKALADQALAALSPEFNRMYAEVGRPSIPPERLLKASLLIALYSVRSERAFCEDLDYNLLFRWFLDMNLMERSFDPTVFTKNRQRLLEHRVGQQLFDEVVAEAQERSLLSDEHFTVDGTLIEAAASLKSFGRRDGDPPTMRDQDSGNPSVDFHGERRVNATHRSTTDPEARLFRKGKGKEAKLVFLAHALMENRNGLPADFQVTQATGRAERDAVPVLLDQARERRFHPKTMCGDKGYDTRDCVAAMGERRVTPHVAQNTTRRSSAIDGRTHLASGVRPEPTGAQAGGRDLWLDEDGGRVPEDAVSGAGPDRPGGLPGSHRLQPGADGEAAGARAGGPGGPGRVTFPGRTVPGRPQ